MEGYELTDRGKIVITVVLVVLLLFLPAAILLYTAVAGQSAQPPDNPDSQTLVIPASRPAENPLPTTTESPPPNGGGFNPQDVSPPDGSGVQEITPPVNGQGSQKHPESGGGIVSAVEGTFSFLFSPGLHSKLDTETSSMLDEFLHSPKNRTDSIIAVETPQLKLEVSEKFVSVIAGALSERGVPQQRIAYITNQEVPEADYFEVKMSYISRSPK